MKKRRNGAALIGLVWVLPGLMACGDDCRKKIRDGDFELSQGNTARAIQLYERAIALGGCSDAAEKKSTAEALQRGK